MDLKLEPNPQQNILSTDEKLDLVLNQLQNMNERIKIVETNLDEVRSRKSSKSSTRVHTPDPTAFTPPKFQQKDLKTTSNLSIFNNEFRTPITAIKSYGLSSLLKNFEIEEEVNAPKVVHKDSIFDQAIRPTSNQIQQHVVMQKDNYYKIKLEEISVDAILNFYKKVVDYDSQHIYKIPSLYLRLKSNVRSIVLATLMTKKRKDYPTPDHLNNATREDIDYAFLYLICPKDQLNFLHLLKESCASYVVKDINKEEFMLTLVSLQVLKEKFVQRYRYLKKACEEFSKEDSIPALTMKPTGVLKMFLRLTPKPLRRSYKIFLETVPVYNSIDHFMAIYFIILEDTLNCAEYSYTYAERIEEDNGLFLSDSDEDDKKKSKSIKQGNTFYNSRRFTTPRRYQTPHGKYGNKIGYKSFNPSFKQQNESVQYQTPSRTPYTPRVNYIQNIDGSDDEDESQGEVGDEMREQDKFEEDDNENINEGDEDEDEASSKELYIAQQNKANNFVNQSQSQSQTNLKQNNKKEVKICIKAERGYCNNQDCPYSHKLKDIQDYRRSIVDRYNDSNREELTYMKNKMQKDIEDKKKLIQTYRNEKTNINVISSTEENNQTDTSSSIHILQSYLSINNFGVINELMKVTDSTIKWKAFHHTAFVELNDGRLITMVATLFDTGADKDNYISTSCIKYHKLESLLDHIDNVVKTANGNSVYINSKIEMVVTFLDRNNVPYSAKLEFMVLDGLNKDIVLGTPTILIYFYEIFKEMLEEARSKVIDNVIMIEDIHTSQLQLSEQIKSSYVGDVTPWINVPNNIAEEELEIPEFGNFDYMEVSIEEATKQYYEKLPTRVSEEFKNTTNIMQLMSTLGEQVFNPKSWNGINGVQINIEFKSELPNRIKPKTYSIPPAQYENVKKEVERLTHTIWEPSVSPIASPMVVAAKATAPFIRLCGDYRVVNKFIKTPHYPIPIIIHEIHKLQRFKLYSEFDLMNSFHQLKLSPQSAQFLSVKTPFGQFQPKYLPEGVSPASGYLMSIVYDIFVDYLEFMIVIFDNLLVLANDYNEMYDKVEKMLLRCKEKNLYLKLSKSNLGIKEVEFFGYIVNSVEYHLSDERKHSVISIPFPEPPKQQQKMQSFLGSCIYFKTFIPLYSEKTALLTDMTHKNFDWNEKTWKVNFRKIFEDLKVDILNAHSAYHPCYELEWILSVDASDTAIGGVLFQIPDNAQNEHSFQVIAFISKKLSETARKWSVIERECYSIFYSVKKLSYYLFGKQFTIRTDHQNLLWMESSQIPKIIRMRIYLQSYNFVLKHIKGKDNVFADFLSRMNSTNPTISDVILNHIYNIEPDDYFYNYNDINNEEKNCSNIRTITKTKNNNDQNIDDVNDFLDQELVQPKSFNDALKLVHNSRVGHHGAVRTYSKLTKYFPGHKIPIRVVEDFVMSCPLCQKNRLDMSHSLIAPVRKLDPESARHFLGYDTIYITPATKDGYQYLHHVRLLPSRFSALYPSKDLTAESVALALFQFFITFGVTDVLITDAGSNINSNVVKLLLNWMGIRLRLAITNRHQSNMVERVHREVKRFLTDLVHEERVIEIWNQPHVIGIIQFIINSERSKETGVSAFQFLFGTVDLPYFKLPELMNDEVKANSYLKVLDENLKVIRDAAKVVQTKEQEKRKLAVPNAGINEYQIGDFVLKRQDPNQYKTSKLSSNFIGPFQVISIYKADITVRNLINQKTLTFHMDDLKPFFGDEETAYKLAMRDDNSYEIESIIGHKGDSLKRKSLLFLVHFKDGDEIWLPWLEVKDTIYFELYCKSKSYLFPLLFSDKLWKEQMKQVNNKPITIVKPGMSSYLNLRYFGENYYERLNLIDKYSKDYVVEIEYDKWLSKGNFSISVKCPIFKINLEWNHITVFLYGCNVTKGNNMVEIDNSFRHTNPEIFED